MKVRHIIYLAFLGVLLAGIFVFTFSIGKKNAPRWKENLVYAEPGGKALHCDVYRSPNATNTQAAVLLVHGGGWTSGNKDQMGRFGHILAKEGMTAVCINYRLTRNATNHFPAALDDVTSALTWMTEQSEELQIDPERIAAIGASAGGHLVSLYGVTQHQNPERPQLRAVVDLFGPSDLRSQFSPTITGIVTNFLGHAREADPERTMAASPISHITSNAPPFYISHGAQDEIVPEDQSARLHEALQAAGVESTYLYFENEGHGLYAPKNMLTYLRGVRGFLTEHLAP